MTKLKYINKTKSLNKFDNFILSAFNLAFIGYFYKKKIKSNKNLIVWPDGIFALKYGCKQKIPGRKIIKTLDKINDIKKIVVLGNCTNKELNFLNLKYKLKVDHYNLRYGEINKIKSSIPKILKNYLYIITLPTPKQEQLAQFISKKFSNYKIICIGGGLAMAAGVEKECPKILDNLGLEFLWRLKSDFFRRIKRLFYTFFLFLVSKTDIRIRKLRLIKTL